MLQRTSFFCPRDVQIPDGRQKAPAPERNPLLSGIFRLRPADVRCGQAAHESDGAVRYAGESLKANNHPARQHSQVSHNPVPAFLAPFTGGLHPGSSAAHKLPAFCRASAAHGLPLLAAHPPHGKGLYGRPSQASLVCVPEGSGIVPDTTARYSFCIRAPGYPGHKVPQPTADSLHKP